MQYINKLLSTWHVNNVKTVEDAEKLKIDWSQNLSKETNKTLKSKNKVIEKEDLSALFDSLEEIEI